MKTANHQPTNHPLRRLRRARRHLLLLAVPLGMVNQASCVLDSTIAEALNDPTVVDAVVELAATYFFQNLDFTP